MNLLKTLPRPCEVIVVLGAAVWPDRRPSPALRRRVAHAVHLLHSGHGKVLLMTGGLGQHPPTEGEVMRQVAIEAGVPAAQILVEQQATSTLESAIYCTRIIRQHGWSTALIVTDRYHLPRALLAFQSFGLQVSGSAAGGRYVSRRWWKAWYAWGREVVAYGWYLLLILTGKAHRLDRKL